MIKKSIYIAFFLFSSAILFSQTYKEIYGTSLRLQADSSTTGRTVTIVAPAGLSSNLTFTLPATNGTNGQILTTDGSGGLSWTTVSGSGVAGSNTQIQYNNSGVLGAQDSLVWIDSTNRLGIAYIDPPYSLSVGGDVGIGSGSQDAGIILYSEQGATDYTFTLSAPASMAASRTYTLPNSYGTNGQLLTTNGSFDLQWSTTAVSNGNDCVGIGADDGDVGNNTVSAALGFIGAGTDNNIGSGGSNSFIAGGADNTVNATASAVTGGEFNNIAAGGWSLIGGGRFNYIASSYSAIMAGEYDSIFAGSDYSFIGAGRYNKIRSPRSSIGAGENNEIDTASAQSFIAAGNGNYIVNAISSSIGAGTDNTINGGAYSFIGAGTDNIINADYSFIAAGRFNHVGGGSSSSILGGENNYLNGNYSHISVGINDTLNGDYSLILGFDSNVDSDFSVAMGRNANVSHDGSFIVKSGDNNSVSSSLTNQFTAQFPGGIRFYTNANANAGAELSSGSNSWSSISDRNRKRDIRNLDEDDIYNRLSLLPIATWTYKDSPDIRIRHYGPMAQDFFSLFGTDELGVFGTTVTVDPLNLTAVGIVSLQKLDKELAQKQDELDRIKKENERLAEEINELESLVKSLEVNR